MAEKWVNVVSGAPVVADFLTTRGQGSPLVVDSGSDQAYYLDGMIPRPLAGGGGANSVADRTELENSTASGALFLREAGREGMFVFDNSDLSAKVTVDPQQGVYVAPATDPTGASGAWVRAYDNYLNVMWFGAVADDATDTSGAFVAAIAFLASDYVIGGYGAGTATLFIPRGYYYLGTTTLDIIVTMVLLGEGVGLTGGAVSKLRWAYASTGIRVQAYNTTGATGVIPSPPNNIAGSGSTIRGLFLQGGWSSGAEAEYHGIHLRGMATVEDCWITNFPGDGIHAAAAAGSGGAIEGNVNVCRINNITVERCRVGVYFDSADSNACSIVAATVSFNRTWGIWDSSFLGNSWFGCHSAGNGWDGATGSLPTACTYMGNRYTVKDGEATWCGTNAPTGTTDSNQGWYYYGAGGAYAGVDPWIGGGQVFREGGAYKCEDGNARSVFVGCYTEGDQNPSSVWSPAVIFGGYMLSIGDCTQFDHEILMTAPRIAHLAETHMTHVDPSLPQFRVINTLPTQPSVLGYGTFGQGYRADNTTLLDLAQVGAYGTSTNPLNTYGNWVIGTKDTGVYTMTIRMVWDTQNTCLRPWADNAYDLGMNAVTRWRSILCYTVDALTAFNLNGVDVRSAYRIQSVTSASTVTPTFANDQVNITALATACQLLNWTGTAADSHGIVIRIKDNGTARALTYDTKYRAIGVTLPTTTVLSKTLYLGCVYNLADDKFDVLAVRQEA